MEAITHTDIMFVLGVLGVFGIVFSVYRYFREPQVDSEKKDALLAQQVQWSAEATERRFKEIQDSFKDLLLQSNNHIHTLDTKVEAICVTLSGVRNDITRLATIIEERIPTKEK